MSNPIKRLNYYDHEFLRSTDFTTEQTYHISMRRLHNQALHTWGVAQGLTLSLAGMTLTVAPGVAMDGQGREMVIGIATNLDLTSMAVNTTQYVVIAYGEQTSDHTTETGGEGDTRWTELPTITMVQTLPADTSLALLLGQITRAQDGSFTVSAMNRQKAATVLPDDLVANSLSLKSATATAAQWPRLASTGPNQAALSGALTATGDVNGNNVVASAYLKGAAANVDGLVNCDQVIQKNPAPDLAVKNSVKVGSPAVSGSPGSISASGDISGNNLTAAASLFADRLRTGPVTSLGGPGAIACSGINAEVDFARRNLTSWPATAAAGDRFAWINWDGSRAALYTDVNGELLSVTSDGKVGIGTVTPSQKLDVQGSISASTDLLVKHALTTGPLSGSPGEGSIYATGASAEFLFVRRDLKAWPTTLSAGDMYCWHNDSGTAQLWGAGGPGNGQLLSVTSDGKLGIGTTTPSQKLDVQGAINASGIVTCDHVVEKNPSPISKFSVSQPINCQTGGLPISGSFSTSGGTILVLATGTAYISWNWYTRQIGMEIFVDDVSRGFAKVYCSPQGANQSFSNFLPIGGLGAGNHTVKLTLWAGQSDGNCFYSVTIIEFPF